MLAGWSTLRMEYRARRRCSIALRGAYEQSGCRDVLAVMLGLASHPAAQSPAGPTDVHMIELAVKDSKRVPESWAYYALRSPNDGRVWVHGRTTTKGQLLQLPQRARGAGQRLHAVLRALKRGGTKEMITSR